MGISIQLAQLKREREAQWGRDISWNEIMEGASISRNTLAKLLRDDTSRIDKETLDGICRFFQFGRGPVPFIVYIPDSES
jgi:DNA-binding Xre family transcriptional regulator